MTPRRKLRELAPLTPEQEAQLAFELAWLETVVPHGTREDTMAMQQQQDPFSVDQPMRLNRARWFAQLWNTFGFPKSVHLRRIHYVLASQDLPIPLAELTKRSRGMYRAHGTTTGMRVYVNSKSNWEDLGDGARDARYLNLVPADAFIDRRNADPQIFLFGEPELPHALPADGEAFNYLGGDWLFPPGWWTDAQEAPKIPQAYHVEVWAEKTTINDILVPICERLRTNLITGAGHLSLTIADDLMARALRSGRPVRVLQIVDADKFGKDMPPAMARKVEFRVRQLQRDPRYADLDIQPRRIVLTPEQIEEYNLPVSPLDGVSVELDALEALHPGVLAGIVAEEISRYLDPDLDEKVKEAFHVFNADIEDANNALVTEAEQGELEDLERQRDALAAEFNAKLAPLNARAEELFAGIDERINAADAPEFEFDRAEIEPAGDEDDDALYDSKRDYDEQLEFYKRYKDENNGGGA